MNNFLLDSEFLAELDNYKQRELYVKIISLTLDEDPLDEIQGRVTGGSISVDGNSKLRRSCSLNLISDRLNVNEYLWCLNTKIRVSIGMRNYINPIEYGEIVWFPQGTFVLNSFNISINNTSSTISLQGKDKMCLLNGDVGGNLTALSYAFDIVEEENGYNSYYKKKLPLRYIIREAVHTFANEPYHNIIINDLDDWGLELLTYRGEEPMYFIYSLDIQGISNMTINKEQEYEYEGSKKTIEQLSRTEGFKFKVLNDFISQDESDASTVYVTNDKTGEVQAFQIIQIDYGMTCGYRLTDLTYVSDLVLNVGDGITSMLDKIVSMLGNFEYFYNLDGQFVFQKKRTYVHTSWNNLVNNGEEQWADSAAYTSSHIYSLYNSKLISSFSNAPALNNVKNDFSIWGTKKGVTGIELPVHMRYAIDKKPIYYTTVDGTKTYTTRTEAQVEEDKKSGILEFLGKGYSKEPSRFGLGEEWWEVRDWANAWVYSGLPVPTKTLGTYCPIRAVVYNAAYEQPDLGSNYEYVPIPAQTWESWDMGSSQYKTTDDLIFTSNGKFHSNHGICGHTYTQWLNMFLPGAQHDGNYAYFYKPQVPAEDLQQNGGQGLLLGVQIIYETDWRELIYQMALDHNKYGNLDNSNPKVQLVKAYSTATLKDEIVTREKCEANPNSYRNIRDISLTTAIRERNPTFYPSGYTGYEQYYIDILGFWRQIYDPEYECTYEIEPITKMEYESLRDPNVLFYDAPVYEACTKDSIYYDSIDYYTKKGDVYTIASMLTETEFNRGKGAGKYYFIKDVEIKPVPIVTETINSKETYYKIGDYEKTATGAELRAGTKDPKLYCKRLDEDKSILVFKLEPFHRAYLYNYYKTGTYYPPTSGITKGDYESRPWYYNRVKNGVQQCCTSIAIPDAAARDASCWFETKDGTKITTKFEINEPDPNGGSSTNREVACDSKISNEDLLTISLTAVRDCKDLGELQTALGDIPWYYCYTSHTYEPLVHPGIEFDPQGTYYLKSDIKEFNSAEDDPPYWKSDLLTNPEGLIFWFDFLDTDGELDSYSVKRIGDRPKAVNDKDVKAIYFRETPGVLILNPDEWNEYANPVNSWDKPTGYVYAQMPKYLQHLFTISSQGKSAKDVLDEYLYQYSYCTETVSVSALPIYHLEPNTRVLIRDDNSHINGEYIINKLTIPLDPKGSMTINAIKAVDRLY